MANGDRAARRVVATTIALPLLHRYGLPVRSGAGRDAARPRPTGGGAQPDLRGGLPTLTTNAWLRFDEIRKGLRIAQPTAVLEIGAGEGGLGSWLAGHYTYTGVELDDQSRAAAEARIAAEGHGTINARLADVADRDFDIVCAFEVLEHIEDDALALKQWREYLRPSGWLLLSVPATKTITARPTSSSATTGATNARPSAAAGERRLRRRPVQQLRRRLRSRAPEGSQRAGRRVLANKGEEGDTPEERTSGSGRLFQPRRVATAVACATLAAPARLVQAPFAGSDLGTGYVVLARRSE